MGARNDTQSGQIQFDEIGGLNQRPAPSKVPVPDFSLLHGLYPPRDGWMQRLEGIRRLATFGTGDTGILNLFQADDGTGDIIAQTTDGSEVRYTLDELFGRESPTIDLTPDPIEEEDSMSMALIVHEENQGTDGGSLNAGAGGESLNTFYTQKLTGNPVNEDSIVTAFRDYTSGVNPNTWDLDAGTYRVQGEMTFCFDYTMRGTIGTFTVTIASPAVFTLNNHGLTAGTAIKFSTTGALPTGLTAGTTYYVIAAGLTTNNFRVSTTVGGAAVNTSGAQSGTHTAAGVIQTESCAAAVYDETNSAVLAVFTPGAVNGQFTTTGASASEVVNMILAVNGVFTLSGAARLSIQAAVNSDSGIQFAAATNCRGESHLITTTLGGAALMNRYTSLRIIKET